MWFEEYGVDGLRLDAVHALRDTSAEHILATLSRETEELSARLGRPLTLIAESDLNDPVMFLPRERGGYGLTAQWSDDYHHALHVALTGETSGYYADFAPLSALGTVATRGFFHAGTWSSFRERLHGVPLDDATEAWRLVTFSQDHDQIGNRAAGDRLTASLTPDRLAVAAVLTVLSPSTPMLFMGEEWGASTPWQFFTAHPEPELGRATAEGRIAEFSRHGWDPDAVPDPQDPETFRRSKLDWTELDAEPHRTLLATYRELIALRRREPDLHSPRLGALRADVDEVARTLVLHRGRLRILVNLGDDDWATDVAGEVLFSTRDTIGRGPATLPPDSAAVVRTG